MSFWVNWVFTQPGYPQLRTCKNNCVFLLHLYATFFAAVTNVFVSNEAITNAPTYLLSSSAFLSIKLVDFCCTWSKSHRLVDISCSQPQYYFPQKYLTGADILFIKLELYSALASKKKSIPDWHLYITQMETKWTKWYAMRSHVIAYWSTELLFSTHTFNFNCFFDDFNCVFMQIRCLSRLLYVVLWTRVDRHLGQSKDVYL